MFVFNFGKKKAYRHESISLPIFEQTQFNVFNKNNLPRILKGSVFSFACEVTPYPASDSILLIGYGKAENLQIWRLSIK